jgi:hypothetical protein
MNVVYSSVSMKSKPTETSSLETECLYGESVEILDQSADWVYCKLNTDNYCGWIKRKGLGKLPNPTHRVLAKRTFVYLDMSPKSNCLSYLPMGSKLVVENIKSNWAKVSFYNNKIKIGYIPSNHIVSLNHKVKDWVNIAQLLDGTPYKWGGRDTLGIDCSSLLQLSYQTYGQAIPRNTSDQIKLKKRNIEDMNDLKRGCVIFWSGHVGIMIDKLNCIHANAYHMQTKIELLSQIINRIGDHLKVMKMMDFN